MRRGYHGGRMTVNAWRMGRAPKMELVLTMENICSTR